MTVYRLQEAIVTILLHSGAYFDFEDPEHSDFTIEDIAHGLAMTCRFAGQCYEFYSVAQHSYHISYKVPSELALQALMHDAAEAFVGDVSKPLKTLLPNYGIIEKRIEKVIFDRFNIPYPLAPEIKEADLRMLVTEQQQMMKNRDDWSYTCGREPFDIKLPHWYPRWAKKMFIDRFKELTK